MTLLGYLYVLVLRVVPDLAVESARRMLRRMQAVSGLVGLSAAMASPLAYALEPRDVFAKAAPSVVVITAQAQSDKVSRGSGVALSSDVVATNCHVVYGASRIQVAVDQRDYEADIIIVARERDICLLRVRSAALRPVAIASPRSIRTGDRVYSIGSPRGLELTISEGLVSGLRMMEHGEVIQTSAPISPGSSGGGLFNVDGELIGLTTFFLKDSQNLNFAVPASAATNLLAEAARPRALTAVPATNDPAVSDALGLTKGMGPSTALKPVFADFERNLAYIRWLGATSARLKARYPGNAARLEFLEATWYESIRAGLEPALVLGVIDHMSTFRKYAISATGARGYMQVAPRWAKTIGDGDAGHLFHMQINLRLGCVILRHYLDISQGDLFYALVRYYGHAQGRDVRLSDRKAIDFAMSVLRARADWSTPEG